MSDLELIVNGKALDLNEGTAVSMVFNNTLLDSEVLQGSYSLPFNLPDTARNRISLGFLGVIENVADMLIEIDCQLRYEVVVINAKLKIRDYTKKGYSVNLQTDIGAIGEKLKTVKINELDLETVPLPLETRPTVSTFFRQTGAISVGTRIEFRVYRQDFTNYIFSVVWGGSIASFLTEVVSRITTPRPGVPAYSGLETYGLFDLVTEGGIYWECQIAGTTGKTPQYSTPYDGGTPYAIGDLVDDGMNVYEATQPSTGVALTDTDYWFLVGEWGYWLPICNTAGWPAAWRSGVAVHWFLYDDPYYPFDLDAEWFESTLYIYDEGVAVSPLDYLLIWSQTITNLSVEAGLQNIDSSSYETNFRLPINRMLDAQVGKKWPETNYVFIPYRNPTSFDDSVLDPDHPTREYINYFIEGKYQYGSVTLSGSSKQFFVPQVSAGYLLRKLFESVGVGYNDQMLIGSAECFDRIQIYSSRTLDKYVRNIGSGWGYFTFPFEFKLQDYLPPVKLGDFLNAFRQFLFLGFVFDQTTKSFKVVRLKDVLSAAYAKDWTAKAVPEYRMEKEDLGGFTLSYTHDGNDEVAKVELQDVSKYTINPEVADIASLPTDISEIGKLRLVTDKQAYYLASWSTAYTVIWTFYSRYLVPYVIGEGKTARKPAISLVLDEQVADAVAASEFTGRSWRLLSVGQKLAIPDLNIESAYSLRLFFNWGLQPDSEGQDYPFGSSQNKNYPGTELGSLSLRYDTDSGIVNRLGKEWLQFLANTKKVYRSVRLNSADILSLAQDDTIRVDRVDYLWKQCKITFPIRKPAEFEFWKKD